MNRPILFSSVLSFCLAACLHAQVNAPKVGIVRYSDHSVHAVFGVADDFVISPHVIASADAISFSDSGGLIANNGHIQLIGPSSTVIAEYDSGESAPVLNIDGALTTAIAWLPAQRALLRWNGKSFILTTLIGELLGPVTSVRVENKTAKLLQTETGGVVSEATVSLETGYLTSLDVLPGVVGPAFQQHSFVLFHDQRGLEIASGNATPRALPLTAPDLTFERMSSDWLHLASAATKQNWIVHLNSTTLELSELPAAPVSAAQEVQQ